MSVPRKKRGSRLQPSARLPHVEATSNGTGKTYLYYRRVVGPDLIRIRLPGPEGSAAFLAAYAVAKDHAEGRERARSSNHTVDSAVTAYLTSADYQQLAKGSREDYRRTLDIFRAQAGHVLLEAMDEAWIEAARANYIEAPIAWNALRSRMIMVIRHFRRMSPGVLAENWWEKSRRLSVPESNAHRPWPPEVLQAVMRAATPEFRALLVGYLLTAQRGGDVTRFRPEQYYAEARTLAVTQQKTGEPIRLHVPDSLARTLDAMRGRHLGRLFVTPRGLAWTTGNAQETLQRLLGYLKLPRYTLHGLRATGPVALKLLGFENRAIRALTGHTSDQNLELYLRGVDHYPLAKAAQEALEGQFADLLAEAEDGANTRRFAGVTGRAARKREPR